MYYSSSIIYENTFILNLLENIPVGCVPSASVATTSCQHWGVYLRGVAPCRGRCTWNHEYPLTHPPPREQTHASENITFPQLRWQAVTKNQIKYLVNYIILEPHNTTSSKL